jgi:hypothetical protein
LNNVITDESPGAGYPGQRTYVRTGWFAHTTRD